MRYTVYRKIVCSRTKIRMISSIRNLCVRILDADRFTIVVFQILYIKSNYLPGIVQDHLNILYGKLSNDRITRWRLLLEEYVHIAGNNNIVADALSRLEKDEDEKLSETEEGLVLSHAMCAVEQNEARVLPETKEDLVHHIMNVDETESEEFPMSPEIIAHEQKKDTYLKEVMKKSDKF
jgi:hypothetical protein